MYCDLVDSGGGGDDGNGGSARKKKYASWARKIASRFENLPKTASI